MAKSARALRWLEMDFLAYAGTDRGFVLETSQHPRRSGSHIPDTAAWDSKGGGITPSKCESWDRDTVGTERPREPQQQSPGLQDLHGQQCVTTMQMGTEDTGQGAAAASCPKLWV